MRSNISRLITIPYSIIGVLILTSLTISAAHVIREVLAKLWCPQRRKRKISAATLIPPPIQATPTHSVRRLNIPQNNIGISKVLPIYDTVSTTDTLESPKFKETGATPPFSLLNTSTTEAGSSLQDGVSRVTPLEESIDSRSRVITDDRVKSGPQQKKDDPPPLLVPKAGAPWALYIALLFICCAVYIGVFNVIFDVDLVTSIQGVLSTTMTVNPGNWFYNVESPTWLIAGIYLSHIFIGRLLISALLLSIWPTISSTFTASGKELKIIAPVMVQS